MTPSTPRPLVYGIVGVAAVAVGVAFTVVIVYQGLDTAAKIVGIIGVGVSLIVGAWSVGLATIAYRRQKSTSAPGAASRPQSPEAASSNIYVTNKRNRNGMTVTGNYNNVTGNFPGDQSIPRIALYMSRRRKAR